MWPPGTAGRTGCAGPRRRAWTGWWTSSAARCCATPRPCSARPTRCAAGRSRPRREPGRRRRHAAAHREVFAEIAALVARGEFAPVVSAAHPLDDAAAAVAAVESGHAAGNVVVLGAA
ncbi:zinc-binding dehydrogenase [Rothia santali]|uniref:zinc-binding dehydrogenase n=1 Tax=Rothia santali TaxID=2949643 RepID=UPI00359FACE8